MALTWTYNAPDEGETIVEVTFLNESPEITHTRAVNAVFDEDGTYNSELTEIRVSEVALGVKNKIAVGVITPPAEESEESEAGGE